MLWVETVISYPEIIVKLTIERLKNLFLFNLFKLFSGDSISLQVDRFFSLLGDRGDRVLIF